MPNYMLDFEDRSFLENYCRDELLKNPIPRETQTKRRKILDHHAMAFVLSEFRGRHPNVEILDANTIKMNNPGYDVLINGRIRVQVKGRCWIEMIDFAVPNLEKAKAWQSDFWIAVDFAGLVDGRHGRYSSTPEMAPSGLIDAYIMPTEILRSIAEEKFTDSKRPRIRAIKPGSKYSRRHHMPELLNYKNKWEVLGDVHVG